MTDSSPRVDAPEDDESPSIITVAEHHQSDQAADGNVNGEHDPSMNPDGTPIDRWCFLMETSKEEQLSVAGGEKRRGRVFTPRCCRLTHLISIHPLAPFSLEWSAHFAHSPSTFSQRALHRSIDDRGLRGSLLRSVYWKIYLGEVGEEMTKWEGELQTKREEYEKLLKKNHLHIVPLTEEDVVEAQTRERMMTSVITPALSSSSNSSDPVDLKKHNPLSTDSSNTWNEHYASSELSQSIRHDLERTYNENEFFSHPNGTFTIVKEMMQNILYLWAKEIGTEKEGRYRQGMNEILAPVILTVMRDSQWKEGWSTPTTEMSAAETPTTRSRSDAGDRTAVPAAAPSPTSTSAAAPTSPPQSLSLLSSVLSRRYVEHDTYHLFVRIMREIGQYFVKVDTTPVSVKAKSAGAGSGATTIQQKIGGDDLHSNSSSSNTSSSSNPPSTLIETAITTKIHYIHHTLLPIFDPQLYQHLSRMEVSPNLYLLRWYRLMLAREFHLEDVLVMWDVVFAMKDQSVAASTSTSSSPPSSKPNAFTLIEYLCIAMLEYVRSALLNGDNIYCLRRLLRYPPVEDIRILIARAIHFEEGWKLLRQDPDCTKIDLHNSSGLTHDEKERMYEVYKSNLGKMKKSMMTERSQGLSEGDAEEGMGADAPLEGTTPSASASSSASRRSGSGSSKHPSNARSTPLSPSRNTSAASSLSYKTVGGPVASSSHGGAAPSASTAKNLFMDGMASVKSFVKSAVGTTGGGHHSSHHQHGTSMQRNSNGTSTSSVDRSTPSSSPETVPSSPAPTTPSQPPPSLPTKKKPHGHNGTLEKPLTKSTTAAASPTSEQDSALRLSYDKLLKEHEQLQETRSLEREKERMQKDVSVKLGALLELVVSEMTTEGDNTKALSELKMIAEVLSGKQTLAEFLSTQPSSSTPLPVSSPSALPTSTRSSIIASLTVLNTRLAPPAPVVESFPAYAAAPSTIQSAATTSSAASSKASLLFEQEKVQKRDVVRDLFALEDDDATKDEKKKDQESDIFGSSSSSSTSAAKTTSTPAVAASTAAKPVGVTASNVKPTMTPVPAATTAKPAATTTTAAAPASKPATTATSAAPSKPASTTPAASTGFGPLVRTAAPTTTSTSATAASKPASSTSTTTTTAAPAQNKLLLSGLLSNSVFDSSNPLQSSLFDEPDSLFGPSATTKKSGATSSTGAATSKAATASTTTSTSDKKLPSIFDLDDDTDGILLPSAKQFKPANLSFSKANEKIAAGAAGGNGSTTRTTTTAAPAGSTKRNPDPFLASLEGDDLFR